MTVSICHSTSQEFKTFYFLLYIVYLRKYCYNEENNLEVLMDLYVLTPPGYEEVTFGMLSVCMCMDVDLADP